MDGFGDITPGTPPHARSLFRTQSFTSDQVGSYGEPVYLQGQRVLVVHIKHSAAQVDAVEAPAGAAKSPLASDGESSSMLDNATTVDTRTSHGPTRRGERRASVDTDGADVSPPTPAPRRSRSPLPQPAPPPPRRPPNLGKSMDELLSMARVAIPAIMNYLYFRGTRQLAVVYFGKYEMDGAKYGVPTTDTKDAGWLKAQFVKLMAYEIWPPLRTDAPDTHAISIAAIQKTDLRALVYVKAAHANTVYVKLVLRANNRIYFDITHVSEEKTRWEGRKLHIRVRDALQSQKALPNYEDYEGYFKAACAYCQAHAGSYTTSVVIRAKAREKCLPFFQRLTRPEGAKLDYKSYFSNPVREVSEKAVKFVCGFLNAYGHGKLLIGVHELPPEGKEGTGGSSTGDSFSGNEAATLRQRNAQIAESSFDAHPQDQVVIGVSLTDDDMAFLQRDLTEQLSECLPPIPPHIVRLTRIPLVLPDPQVLPEASVLVLWEEHRMNWRDIFRTKSNLAIRVLQRYGRSLCPTATPPSVQAAHSDDAVIQCFVIVLNEHTAASSRVMSSANLAGLSTPQMSPAAGPCSFPMGPMPPDMLLGSGAMPLPDFSSPMTPSVSPERAILDALDRSKKFRNHMIVTVEDLPVPDLCLLEVSVDIKRADTRTGPSPLARYLSSEGKVFNGWPMIPLWNPRRGEVDRVERNYDILSGKGRRTMTHSSEEWWTIENVIGAIWEFLVGPTPTKFSLEGAVQGYRSVSSSFNDAFLAWGQWEKITSLCPVLACEAASATGPVPFSAILGSQNACIARGVPTLPLQLTWVLETIGSLPAPYPYIPVPLSMMHLRPAPTLFPIFFERRGAVSLHTSVVLDAQDSHIKLVDSDGNGSIRSVRGVHSIVFDRTHAPQTLRSGKRLHCLRFVAGIMGMAGSLSASGPGLPPSPQPTGMYARSNSTGSTGSGDWGQVASALHNIQHHMHGSHNHGHSVVAPAFWTLPLLLHWLHAALTEDACVMDPSGHTFGFPVLPPPGVVGPNACDKAAEPPQLSSLRRLRGIPTPDAIREHRAFKRRGQRHSLGAVPTPPVSPLQVPAVVVGGSDSPPPPPSPSVDADLAMMTRLEQQWATQIRDWLEPTPTAAPLSRAGSTV